MMIFPKNRRRITGIMMSFCLLISCIAGCASGIPGSAASVPEETDRTAAGFRPGEYDWPTEPGSDRYAGDRGGAAYAGSVRQRRRKAL